MHHRHIGLDRSPETSSTSGPPPHRVFSRHVPHVGFVFPPISPSTICLSGVLNCAGCLSCQRPPLHPSHQRTDLLITLFKTTHPPFLFICTTLHPLFPPCKCPQLFSDSFKFRLRAFRERSKSCTVHHFISRCCCCFFLFFPI